MCYCCPAWQLFVAFCRTQTGMCVWMTIVHSEKHHKPYTQYFTIFTSPNQIPQNKQIQNNTYNQTQKPVKYAEILIRSCLFSHVDWSLIVTSPRQLIPWSSRLQSWLILWSIRLCSLIASPSDARSWSPAPRLRDQFTDWDSSSDPWSLKILTVLLICYVTLAQHSNSVALSNFSVTPTPKERKISKHMPENYYSAVLSNSQACLTCPLVTVGLTVNAASQWCCVSRIMSGAISNRRPIFLQCFDTVGWVIWPVKPVPDMTYNVFGGTLNPAQSNPIDVLG